MNNPISCGGALVEHIIPFLQNSGRFVYHMGHYEECLSNSDMRYNFITYGVNKTNAGLTNGMCLPKQCTHHDISATIDQLLASLALPYSVFSINSQSQNYHYPFDWLFFFTVFLLVAFVVLVIVATCQKPKSLLSAFNIKKNLAIFKKDQKSGLNILNGVRALAMMYVVFGHSFSLVLGGTLNLFTIDRIATQPFFLIVESGLLSVDVFFFLGGFFLAFVFLRQRNTSILKYPIGILQRALRIWPAYLITILFYYSVFLHLGSGPVWGTDEPVVQICSSMYRSLFFYDNFYQNGEQICLGWGWYLQVDFQLFLLCLIILFIYSKNKIASYATIAILISFSCYFNIQYTQRNGQKLFVNLATFAAFGYYFTDIYIKPYARLTPYLIGLIFGIIYTQKFYNDHRKPKSEVELQEEDKNLWHHKLTNILHTRKLIRISIEWIGIGLMAFIAFIPRTLQNGEEWDQIWHSLYFFFSKPIFVIGIILVVFPSMIGVKNSFFKLILDTSLFNFMAKISFCTYLIHIIILNVVYQSKTFDTYYSITNTFVIYLSILLMSLFFGFLLTMVVEVPFSHLQKVCMGHLLKRQRKEDELKASSEKEQLLINRSLVNNQNIKERKNDQ